MRASRSRVLVAIVGLMGVGLPWAGAQRAEGPRGGHPGWRGEPGAPRSRPAPDDGEGHFGLSAKLFEIQPEDRGPLTPEEAEDLLAFARQHMERYGRALERLRQHDPARFEELLAEQAPRLRQLKRVYEHSPRIAEIIREHAHTLFEIRRAARRLAFSAEDSSTLEERRARVRTLLGRTVQLEAEAMEVLAAELDANRAKYAAQRLEYVLDPGSDLSTVPEKVIELVQAYQAAEDGPDRSALRAEIQGLIERQLARRSELLRARSAEYGAGLDALVEARLQKIEEAKERRGPGGRGRRP